MKRYGISSWIVRDLPVGDAIEELAASGFKEVELSAEESELVRAWEEDPVGIRRKLKSAGMDVPSIHSPGPGRYLDVADDAARQESIAANLEYFNRMNESAVKEIVIHPTHSGDFSTGEERAGSRARSIESLKALAKCAAQTGVRMAVEDLGSYGRPGSTMAELLDMIEGLGDHVGLCFDIGHAQMAHFDLVNELRTATSAGKLFSLHLHDVNAEGKDHFIPGEGRINFGVFLSELDASGFQGGRTLEISPPETDVIERLRKVAALRDEWEET